MSYVFTKQDMREERARGRFYARKEIGDILAALANDTSVKLDDDTIDRQTLAEDLVTRLVSLSKSLGSDAANLFDSLDNFHGDNPRIPLEGEKSSEVTQEIGVAEYQHATGTARVFGGTGDGKTIRTPLVSDATIREAAMMETWDGGYPRHGFERGTLDQFRCGAQIRSVYSHGDPVTCGRLHSHEIHNMNPEVQR